MSRSQVRHLGGGGGAGAGRRSDGRPDLAGLDQCRRRLTEVTSLASSKLPPAFRRIAAALPMSCRPPRVSPVIA